MQGDKSLCLKSFPIKRMKRERSDIALLLDFANIASKDIIDSLKLCIPMGNLNCLWAINAKILRAMHVSSWCTHPPTSSSLKVAFLENGRGPGQLQDPSSPTSSHCCSGKLSLLFEEMWSLATFDGFLAISNKQSDVSDQRILIQSEVGRFWLWSILGAVRFTAKG